MSVADNPNGSQPASRHPEGAGLTFGDAFGAPEPARGTPGAAVEPTTPPFSTQTNQTEPAPPANMRPYPGSFYYKSSSAAWNWTGIEGTARLGQPALDPHRMAHGKPLDGFSVYLGGNAGPRTEVDAGLSWDKVTDSHGHGSLAWRPFYRNGKWHWASDAKTYWKPGEPVAMSLTVAGNGMLRMHIADPGAHPRRSVDVFFPARGFSGEHAVQFKRVNAIDEAHREGKSVLPSHSNVVGAGWLSTELLHAAAGGGIERLPFTYQRRASVEEPGGHVVVRSNGNDAAGGLGIDIYGDSGDLRAAQRKPRL